MQLVFAACMALIVTLLYIVIDMWKNQGHAIAPASISIFIAVTATDWLYLWSSHTTDMLGSWWGIFLFSVIVASCIGALCNRKLNLKEHTHPGIFLAIFGTIALLGIVFQNVHIVRAHAVIEGTVEEVQIDLDYPAGNLYIIKLKEDPDHYYVGLAEGAAEQLKYARRGDRVWINYFNTRGRDLTIDSYEKLSPP